MYIYLHPLSSLKFKYNGYPSIFAKNSPKFKIHILNVDSSIFRKFERFLGNHQLRAFWALRVVWFAHHQCLLLGCPLNQLCCVCV